MPTAEAILDTVLIVLKVGTISGLVIVALIVGYLILEKRGDR
jgi:hypothetical protein